MATIKIRHYFICLCLLLFSVIEAKAFDITKLYCLRQERQSNQIYLSEITFCKAGTSNSSTRFNPRVLGNDPEHAYEGEVVSYSLINSTKRYVSGYSLFSISFKNDVISGLTGDPITRADGSFSLTRMNLRNSGIWRFAYSNTAGQDIQADFKCIYKESSSDFN